METDRLLRINVKLCQEPIEDNSNQAVLVGAGHSGAEHHFQGFGVDNSIDISDVETRDVLVQPGDGGEVHCGCVPQEVRGLRGVGVDGDDGLAGAGHNEAASP